VEPLGVGPVANSKILISAEISATCSSSSGSSGSCGPSGGSRSGGMAGESLRRSMAFRADPTAGRGALAFKGEAVHPRWMPSVRARGYVITPGERLEIEVEDVSGGRAIVMGRLDSILHALWGGRALKIRICEARACALPAKK
jgi:hypothetical protein